MLVLEEDTHIQIESLLEQRAKLELDFEGNYDEIVAIDHELENLGVEEISDVEMRKKQEAL